VVGIVINEELLISLSLLKFNNFSLFPMKNELKNKENKVWHQNVFFKKLKGPIILEQKNL